MSGASLSGALLAMAARVVSDEARVMFALFYDADGREFAIACGTCGAVSHHPDDVRHRYCGRCARFHFVSGWPRRAEPGA